MDQPRNKMLLTPVNLKLVNDITQSQPFCLDSKTIEWIEFVALVTGYDENRTSYVLTFMDEYSTFQGIIYRKDMEIRPKALRNYVYINSSYAHVVGVLASFEEGPKIIIHSIENIKKYEIINYFKVKVL